MTLKNALSYFKSLVSESSEKSEIKVYQEFIEIIISLENRNLSENEIQSIEAELDALDLNTTAMHDKKYFVKALKQFKKYLKDTLSLTTKGYYTHIGLGLGLSFGILFGIVFMSSFERSVGIALGISFGMLIGLIIGRNLDAQVKTSGNMI